MTTGKQPLISLCITCIYQVISMTQEVIMMNGSEPPPRHMSPCGYNVGREGNLSITVSTRGGLPSWVSGFAIGSWRLPLPSRLLSQAALKVQSRHGKRWKLRWKSDDEDKNYRGIGARKWVLRVLLTREHAGILPNQSNPPKLTLLVRHPMIPYGTHVPPTRGSALREPPRENLWFGGSLW